VRQAAALAVSDIPFKYPVAGVRVSRLDGEFILFPSIEQIKESDLDLVVAGHKNAISMVEAGATEVSEEDMVEALKFASRGDQDDRCRVREVCKRGRNAKA